MTATVYGCQAVVVVGEELSPWRARELARGYDEVIAVIGVDRPTGTPTALSIWINGRLLRAGLAKADDEPRITLDVYGRAARVDGRAVPLRRREYDLLAYLMDRPGNALSRQHLLQAVWGFETGSTATVTVHMRQLRRKLEADPARPEHLLTVRGIGYRFDPGAESTAIHRVRKIKLP